MSTGLSALKPSIAKIIFKNRLSNRERLEIDNFLEIYYVGREETKKYNLYTIDRSNNRNNDSDFGNDDFRYIIELTDHIRYQYEILEHIGQGSYGSVVKCRDHKNDGKLVAIKISRNHECFYEQALIEINILKKIQENYTEDESNNIFLKEYFIFRDHIFMVFPLLGKSIYSLIKDNKYKGFSVETCRKYASQIMNALLHLKKFNIIHCDLKPENIMTTMQNKELIKIIDFGSSCFTDEKIHTYIQSRFYRAPEIILGIPYGISIDIWSYGCVLYELAVGQPLFNGINEIDQLGDIMSVFGFPPMELLTNDLCIKNHFNYEGDPVYCKVIILEDGAKRLVGKRNKNSNFRFPPGKRSIRKNIPIYFDNRYMDLLYKCLEYLPIKRITPELAVFHDWLQDYNTLKVKNKSSKEASFNYSANTSNSILSATSHSSVFEFSQLEAVIYSPGDNDLFPAIPENTTTDNISNSNNKNKLNRTRDTRNQRDNQTHPIRNHFNSVSGLASLDNQDKNDSYQSSNTVNYAYKEQTIDRYGHVVYRVINPPILPNYRATVNELDVLANNFNNEENYDN